MVERHLQLEIGDALIPKRPVQFPRASYLERNWRMELDLVSVEA